MKYLKDLSKITNRRPLMRNTPLYKKTIPGYSPSSHQDARLLLASRLLLGPSWSGSGCSLSSTPTKILKLKVIITSRNFVRLRWFLSRFTRLVERFQTRYSHSKFDNGNAFVFRVFRLMRGFGFSYYTAYFGKTWQPGEQSNFTSLLSLQISN